MPSGRSFVRCRVRRGGLRLGPGDLPDEGLLDVLCVFGGHDLSRCSDCESAAPMHQRDAVAAFGLVHEMGRDEDGDAFPARKLQDQAPEIVAGLRIDAGGRLVQDQDFWPVQTGGGELQALALAQRQLAGQGIGDARELEALECSLDARLHLRGFDAIELRVQREVGPHRQLLIEREALRHVADLQPRCDVLRLDRSAEQLGLAFAGGQQAGQHLHGRGLAGAVRAEEAEDLAALDAEARMIDRDEIAEPPRQSFGDDGRRAVMLHAGRDRERRRQRPIAAMPQGDIGSIEMRGTRRGDDLPGAARRQHATLVDRDQLVEAFRLFHIGGRYQHGHGRPIGADLRDQLPELAARERIDACRRLVEDQQIGIVHQRAAETELLLHAAGKLAGRPVGKRREPGRREQPSAPLGESARIEAEKIGEEVDVLGDGKGRIEVAAEALRHKGDARADLASVPAVAHVAAEHRDRAGLDSLCAGDDAEQSGFSHAVRADQRHRCARRNLQADGVERQGLAVPVREAVDPQGWPAGGHARAYCDLPGSGGSLAASASGQAASACTFT